jgi:type IV secretory pathway TrbD component
MFGGKPFGKAFGMLDWLGTGSGCVIWFTAPALYVAGVA